MKQFKKNLMVLLVLSASLTANAQTTVSGTNLNIETYSQYANTLDGGRGNAIGMSHWLGGYPKTASSTSRRKHIIYWINTLIDKFKMWKVLHLHNGSVTILTSSITFFRFQTKSNWILSLHTIRSFKMLQELNRPI